MNQKKKIVIDNYFKRECDVNTSIKEAFTKGFEVELTKAVFPKDQYEARLKADIVAILDNIRVEINSLAKTYPFVNHIDTYVKEDDVLEILDKYKAESYD